MCVCINKYIYIYMGLEVHHYTHATQLASIFMPNPLSLSLSLSLCLPPVLHVPLSAFHLSPSLSPSARVCETTPA